MNTASAYAFYAPVSTFNGNPIYGLRMFFSDKVDTCTSRHLKSATVLDLSIPGSPVSPGTFTVIDPTKDSLGDGKAEGDFNTSSDTCGQGSVSASTVGGTVVLTQTSPSIKGTLDLQFPNGDVVRGAFDATDCGPPPDAGDGGIVCN